MTLINTDGMAFIGPGSEWFWTALTGIVLAVTFIAIARQLRLQAHAGAVAQMESFDRESTSELMSRYLLELLVALRDRKDPSDLPRPAAMHIATFWETFATLARSGHRDAKLLWHMDPYQPQIVWASLAPWASKERADSGQGDFLEQLEWLAGVMAEMDRRAGRPAFSSDLIPIGIKRGIDACQERIRMTQALRTVTVTQPVAVTFAQPAPAE